MGLGRVKEMRPAHRGSQIPHGSIRSTSAELRLRLGATLVLIDCCAITAGLMTASLIRLSTNYLEQLQTLLPVLLVIYVLAGASRHAFDLQSAINGPPIVSARRSVLALLITVALTLAIGFLLKVSADFSRVVLVLTFALSTVLLLAGRDIFRRFAMHISGGRIFHLVVLLDGVAWPGGDNPGEMSETVDTVAQGLEPRLDDPIAVDRLARAIAGADRIIVACAPERRGDWSRALRGSGVSVELLAPELDKIGAIGVARFCGLSTARVSVGPLKTSDRAMKRLLDLSVVALASPFALLLALVVGLAIKIEDSGPVLFVQPRIGQGNRLFRLYKFRSMRAAEGDWAGAISTGRKDPRVTRIGRIIRRLSIDEIPQLLNILKGEMSVVGPRPHAVGSTAEDALFWEIEARYWDRHAIKPGLTGLAQIRGFRGATEQRTDLTSRLDADLAYLDAWTIWRDLGIIGSTFAVLFHKRAF